MPIYFCLSLLVVVISFSFFLIGMGKPTGRQKVGFSHSSARFQLCLLHMKKSRGLQKITARVQSQINLYHLEGLDSRNERLPGSVCRRCRSGLSLREQGKSSKLPPIFNYSKVLNPLTRSVTNNPDDPFIDPCFVCRTAKQNPRGNAKSSSHSMEKTGKVPLLCGYCGSIVSRGKSHICSTSRVAQNLTDHFESQEIEQVASSTLKRKVEKSEDQNNGSGLIDLKTGGSKLPVLVKPPKESTKKQLSTEDLARFMTDDKLRYNSCVVPSELLQLLIL